METRINGGCEKYINTVYEEGLYVGYRYFDTFSKPVAYGFGHGLSYTTFACEYKSSKCETPETLDTIVAEVEAIVTNTGNHTGKEVIRYNSNEREAKRGFRSRSQLMIAGPWKIWTAPCRSGLMNIFISM